MSHRRRDWWTLFWSSLVFLLLYVAVFNLQAHLMMPIQRLFLSGTPFLLVVPLHGLRILAAWFFGWWSIIVMLPATAYVYLGIIQAFGAGYVTMWLHAVALTYLVSGPLSFSILRWCLGLKGHPNEIEWRMIMLAGLMSALINVLALGVYNPPNLESRETLLWLVVRAASYTFGLFVVLLFLMQILRLLGRTIRRDTMLTKAD